ncbi:hypothetical protein [Hymenobacter convexus]|uniref:hypothetical protein n=1 Tax=Hymenobacter sp. CA1UV-4 TaxID=3063782 RepID=UPI00272A75BF|nr:hypothetical protein [Hymenobacter sp. CA1UV-4]
MLQALLVLVACACFSPREVAAQTGPSATFGLSLSDLQAVVQQALDLPALQQYYPVDANNTLQPVNIVQLPLAMPAGLTLTKGGSPVNFIAITPAQFSNLAVDAYAMFRSIEASGTGVSVRFNYFYKAADNSPHTASVALQYQQDATGWHVVNSTVNDSAL